MEKESKIFVAGHRGLVGSAIYNNLKSKGYQNLVVRTRQELDLMDSVATKLFFNQEKPEYVILAAAHVGGIMANNTYRADFIYRNLQIQQNVIGEAWKNAVKKLLFLGSTCIYPREAPQPMSENCLLTSSLEYTNEPYAIAKIAGLKLCESINIQYGTNFISVMPTNLYGPHDNFDLEKSHVMPAMIRKIYLAHCLHQNDWMEIRKDLSRRPIERIEGESSEAEIIALLAKYGVYNDRVELWGTGRPTREFLWSEEMADACVHLMEHVDASQLGKSYHINIGTGEEISIRCLAEHIIKVVGYQGSLFFDSTKPDGTMRKLTDPSRLHALGWHHQIEVKAGVEKLYKWYKGDL